MMQWSMCAIYIFQTPCCLCKYQNPDAYTLVQSSKDVFRFQYINMFICALDVGCVSSKFKLTYIYVVHSHFKIQTMQEISNIHKVWEKY